MLNVGRAHTPQAYDPGADVIELSAVFDGAAAVTQAPMPLAESVRGRAQIRDRSDSPPPVALRLEAGKGALTGIDRLAKPAGDQVGQS